MASDLGLHGLPMLHKKDARLIWVKVLANIGTIDNASLPNGLTKVIRCQQYITLLSLWDFQCIPRKHVLNGLKCNGPSQEFRRRLF